MPKKDENTPHYPNALKKDFDKKLEICKKYSEKGVPAKDIIQGVFGMERTTYNRWVDYATEDREKGFTAKDSNLIKLMDVLERNDLDLHGRLIEKAVGLATDDEEPDSNMLKYLLDKRTGYGRKQKSEIELSTKDDKPVEFRIVSAEEVMKNKKE